MGSHRAGFRNKGHWSLSVLKGFVILDDVTSQLSAF